VKWLDFEAWREIADGTLRFMIVMLLHESVEIFEVAIAFLGEIMNGSGVYS
jgi:hypothetical protein